MKDQESKTPEKTVNQKRMKPIILFIIIAFIPAVYFFLFMNNDADFDKATDQLTGDWLRSDGTYSISVSNVQPEGKLEAAYFNPNAINVERSEWSVQDKKLLLYVEMNDVNYKGSNYRLTYIEQSDQLVGYYYQAVAKETYEVSFNRK